MRVLLTLLISACLLLAADKFSGKWARSRNDDAGTIDIQLAEPAAVTFTLRGQQVKTKVLTVKKESSVVEVRYQFDLDGTQLISTLTGRLDADKLEGKYQTTNVEGEGVVDSGTFTTASK